MGIWPFSRKHDDDASKNDNASKDDKNSGDTGTDATAVPGAASKEALENLAIDPATGTAMGDTTAGLVDTAADAAAATGIVSYPHDAVGGESGPFDGDSVDINDFDFADFSVGILDLGSIRIPLPKESQVQVEMGENGPRMLHIVTHHGRITPVAFAAPRHAGQWVEAAQEIIEGMSNDGLSTTTEIGPWGTEIVGTNGNGQIRVIGVEGPRWMLRMTLAAPAGKEEELVALGREVVARSFVYRGENPVLAGNSLPVTLPKPLAEQVQQAIKQRQEQEKSAAANSAQHPENGVSDADQQALDEAREHLRNLGSASSAQENEKPHPEEGEDKKNEDKKN
ncbi:hypothetical protein CFL01nite_03020 [Corynebacterium flavescens]|uniref:DUF3710 domain-containing protein n=2 Tax=Corynebacterium flavescens TaxID=28028 RepID=A0AB73B596_CORFL|nr:DUF3710 domain-containing protein [Corynebacterium flavescens]KAA8721806.1 DUF3710 domain-containing protein [Corynebacterium flavescens]GEB96807.1 hypothetical protein CFL01nite_03020 [Corynebacterium flavescens]